MKKRAKVDDVGPSVPPAGVPPLAGFVVEDPSAGAKAVEEASASIPPPTQV